MNPTRSDRRLWGIGTARTLRPHWMLAELGLEYETVEILTRTEAMNAANFRALSKRGKIPIYEEPGLVIGESAAISLYLADAYRDQGVFAPRPGTQDRARHDEICFYVMTEMDSVLYIIRRHAGLSHLYGESTVAVEAARVYFQRGVTEMASRLADGRPHLLGDEFCVADLLLKTCLDWAGTIGIELPEALALYGGAMGRRPAFRVAMQKNFTAATLAALNRSAGARNPTRHSV